MIYRDQYILRYRKKWYIRTEIQHSHSALGVMDLVENELEDSSSNPRRDHLHFKYH